MWAILGGQDKNDGELTSSLLFLWLLIIMSPMFILNVLMCFFLLLSVVFIMELLILHFHWSHRSMINNTGQQDFGTRKVYCVSNVPSHAESKYAIKIFPSPTAFYNGLFNYWFFGIFWYFHQWFFYTWTNILNGFEQRVVTYNLPLSYL